VITAGMAAAAGHQNLLLVITVAMIGSVIGESTCYFMGRGSGPALHRWMKRQERRQQMYDKVSAALHARGGLILMTVRYIPGARMVATLTAGATRYSFKKFIVFTIAGVTVAYTYVALLGYLGGDAFAHDSLKALAFSLSLAALIGLLVEISRRIAVKRRAAKVTAG
jgi:membrane-associated protein